MAEPTEPASVARHDGGRDGPDNGPGQTPAAETVATTPDSPPANAADPAGAPITTHISWPRLARAEIVPDRPPRAENRGTPRALRQRKIWIAAQVYGFGLLLAGYFLGWVWPPVPPSENPPAVSSTGYAAPQAKRAARERVWAAVDRALKAERDRDYEAARVIYEEMINRQEPMPRAEYRLALLSLHQGDLLQTEVHLNRSVQAGNEVADCSLLRASLAGMKGNYADAATQLAAAVRAQPFSAKFCFCWGESLRRAGRLTDAIERLTQTLDRPDNAAARVLYQFKWRLAKIESDGDDAFAADVAAHVEQPNPGGDWLMLAAAREIGRRNYALAAERLQQARGTLPPQEFGVYAQDYLFQVQAVRPDLRAVLTVPPPVDRATAGAPLQDPAVWTAAEADPAVWPPFPRAE